MKLPKVGILLRLIWNDSWLVVIVAGCLGSAWVSREHSDAYHYLAFFGLCFLYRVGRLYWVCVKGVPAVGRVGDVLKKHRGIALRNVEIICPEGIGVIELYITGCDFDDGDEIFILVVGKKEKGFLVGSMDPSFMGPE